MYDTPPFEIPSAVRQLAQQNMSQVRQAYDQMLTLMGKAHEAAVKSQGAMAQTAVEIQAKALEFAQSSVMANLNFATELAAARDLKEYLEVQSRFAQSQLEAYAHQSQEITRLMNEAAHKAKP